MFSPSKSSLAINRCSFVDCKKGVRGLILETTLGKCILQVMMPEKSMKELEYAVIVEASFNEEKEKVDAVLRPRRTRCPYQQSRRHNSAEESQPRCAAWAGERAQLPGWGSRAGKSNRRFPKLILKACLGFQMELFSFWIYLELLGLRFFLNSWEQENHWRSLPFIDLKVVF